MKTVKNIYKETAMRLMKDIAGHKKYINAAPSLNYKRYVAVVHIVGPSGLVDTHTAWTVQVNCYGVALNKNTTAENFDTFGSRIEAVRACKKLRLVDAEGKRVKAKFEIIEARDWNRKRVQEETEMVETFHKLWEAEAV